MRLVEWVVEVSVAMQRWGNEFNGYLENGYVV